MTAFPSKRDVSAPPPSRLSVICALARTFRPKNSQSDRQAFSTAVELLTFYAMATAFSIGSPTVITTLPRPIDRSNGRYVVSDVHGGNRGSRKRKRAELAVGVDGEGLSIYDVREIISNGPTVANPQYRQSHQSLSLPMRYLRSPHLLARHVLLEGNPPKMV